MKYPVTNRTVLTPAVLLLDAEACEAAKLLRELRDKKPQVIYPAVWTLTIE